MAKKIEASIIIPTYNRSASIVSTLRSFNKQVCDILFEVIVIDDGSSDGTFRELSQIIGQLKFPLHTIRIDRSGPGLARNHGVQIAKEDIILFTDSDCIPDCNWIENMVRSVKK